MRPPYEGKAGRGPIIALRRRASRGHRSERRVETSGRLGGGDGRAMTARGGGEPRSTDGGGGAAKDSGRAVDGVPPSNEEPHVGGAPRDEGDDHARVSSAAWTSPVEDRSVVRGRPARRGGGGGGGGGDHRARDASSRDRAAKGDRGSRSPRRSSRGGVSPLERNRHVSPSPPPSVTRRDVYALETLSVGLPAGLANPTASCVHTSGPTPDEEHERTSKDLSEYHLAKHQRSRLHHRADHHADHVQHHHQQRDPGGDASPAPHPARSRHSWRRRSRRR